jgi:hypothetical protein
MQRYWLLKLMVTCNYRGAFKSQSVAQDSTEAFLSSDFPHRPQNVCISNARKRSL